MRLRQQLVGHLPALGAVLVLGFAAWGISQAPASVRAQSNEGPSQLCRAAVIIDRSGSVGGNMPTLKEQIKRLFQPTGLYDDKIEISFWSFSHAIGGIFAPLGNYDAPFYGYVTSRGETTGFMSALNSVQPGGNTNYQQAFAYDGETRNPALNDIIEATDILVFMTDGQPNSVNQGGVSAEDAGRIAAQKHIDAGRVVIGGSIGANAAQVRVINYVVSNDPNNYNNTFTVSTNYNDLAVKLRDQINRKCREIFPPDPCPYNANLPASSPDCKPPQPAFTLVPSTSVDNTVISSDESAGFRYRVNNESPTTTSPEVGWSIKQVVVDKGQSSDPLALGNDAYRDGYTCAALLNLIGNKGTCQDVSSGSKQFSPGSTTLSDTEVGAANRLVVDDKWPVGTKVCFVLALAKPTEKDSPTNRFSKASCVVIGKRPTVQVHGGDLSVGRRFNDDPEPLSPLAAKVQGGLTVKGDPINRVFGSWAEYGVFAPDAVVGFGSALGLENGHQATSGNTQELWSKLTFANTQGQFGFFAESGTIPDAAGALLSGHAVVSQITGDKIAFNGQVPSGIYEKLSGDVTVDTGRLGKGSSVVLHVPNGTVTIDASLYYTDEPLGSLNDIPRLVIIARNININAEVNQIDAWLIARNSPTSTGGGIINTCSDGPAALSITDCDKSLVINGPVMARTLLLRRTAGSGIGASSGDPAEVINLRADAYLSALARRTEVNSPMTTFTVELPPRF